MAERHVCHDCRVEEGQLHDFGCDMERCPLCGGQLISCPCMYKFLGYKYDWNAQYHGLPEEVYNNGVSKDQEKAWMGFLEGIRVPWVMYPNVCAKCGELWPDMFMVPDEEWKRYIQKSEQNKMLCRKCYDFIKGSIDRATLQRQQQL